MKGISKNSDPRRDRSDVAHSSPYTQHDVVQYEWGDRTSPQAEGAQDVPSEAVRTEQAGRVYARARQGVGGTVSPRGLNVEFLEFP